MQLLSFLRNGNITEMDYLRKAFKKAETKLEKEEGEALAPNARTSYSPAKEQGSLLTSKASTPKKQATANIVKEASESSGVIRRSVSQSPLDWTSSLDAIEKFNQNKLDASKPSTSVAELNKTIPEKVDHVGSVLLTECGKTVSVINISKAGENRIPSAVNNHAPPIVFCKPRSSSYTVATDPGRKSSENISIHQYQSDIQKLPLKETGAPVKSKAILNLTFKMLKSGFKYKSTEVLYSELSSPKDSSFCDEVDDLSAVSRLEMPKGLELRRKDEDLADVQSSAASDSEPLITEGKDDSTTSDSKYEPINNYTDGGDSERKITSGDLPVASSGTGAIPKVQKTLSSIKNENKGENATTFDSKTISRIMEENGNHDRTSRVDISDEATNIHHDYQDSYHGSGICGEKTEMTQMDRKLATSTEKLVKKVELMIKILKLIHYSVGQMQFLHQYAAEECESYVDFRRKNLYFRELMEKCSQVKKNLHEFMEVIQGAMTPSMRTNIYVSSISYDVNVLLLNLGRMLKEYKDIGTLNADAIDEIESYRKDRRLAIKNMDCLIEELRTSFEKVIKCFKTYEDAVLSFMIKQHRAPLSVPTERIAERIVKALPYGRRILKG